MESPSIKDLHLVDAQEDSSSLDDSSIADVSLKSGNNHETSSTIDVSKNPINDAQSDESSNQIINPLNSCLEVITRLVVDEKDSPIVTKESPRIPESSVDLDGPLVIPFDPENPESSRISSQTLNKPNGIVDRCENNEKSSEGIFNLDENPATSSSESTPSRKRPAGEFSPINAEIKRIGVEISEEHAQQLKNDIRRLSPVLVSLRERTLGEISLTSDSGLFDDEAQPPKIEESEERLIGESTESLHQTGDTSGVILSEDSLSRINEGLYDPLIAKSDQESTNHTAEPSTSCNDSSNVEEVKENPTSASTDEIRQPNNHLDFIDQSRSSENCVIQEMIDSPSEISCSTLNRSNVQRELVIVLSRVDDDGIESTNKSDEEIRNEKSDCVVDGIDIDGDRTLTCVVGEASTSSNSADCESLENSVIEIQKELKTVKSEEKIEDSSIKENSVHAGNFCLSPKYLGNDQLSRKSPKVVIERTLETPSPSTKLTLEDQIDRSESLQRLNLDCVRKTLVDSLIDDEDEIPADSLAIGGDPLRLESPDDVAAEVTSDLQESLDTETETETVSDSSELTSMTSVNLSDCVEPINGSSSCPETDSLPSDEVPGDMMTRLEPERPEAFTEDSAESLALATGTRDEVRSDGSDSGLGSEIPGDPGPAPAPESDSETSFLDRIPDDILTDKDKVVNPLEAFVPDAGTSATQQPQQQQQQQQQQIPLTNFPSPPKSSLKRRLTDCMEGEPSPKRMNTEDTRKKRNIQFDAVTVYYFPRAQGFTCVPSQGGSTLGMSATHTHAERFSLAEHATEQRRIHRARLAQLRSERAANCVTEAASSSEDPSDDTDEEPSDTEELDIDSYYFLQPVPTWQRRALLRAAGVRRIDAVEKDDCRDIRASREHCGCGCKGYCDPESCPCSRANVKCQVDRAGFPCGCSRDGCANSSGRIEFNPVRVRTHFIHTLMRLQLEKKQRDEDRTDHDLLSPTQSSRGPMREVPGLMANPMEHPNVIPGDQVSCINAGGFTTLHYENHETASTSCQPIVHAGREDSLDLYAIRDDCYPTDPESVSVDGIQNSPRKLHPEFGQAFQTFPGQQQQQQQQSNVSFPQGYQDYQGYQTLASTSRTQFQPQFQTIQPNNSGFSHYAYGQDPNVIQTNVCTTHQGPSHHVYENSFNQEDPSGSQQQYTNLNSVQPMNAVVQQMGKLEPFSELLAGRYSYYGDVESSQPLGGYQQHNGTQKIEEEKNTPNVSTPAESTSDDCDENFGEIIKKSMVETVSA